MKYRRIFSLITAAMVVLSLAGCNGEAERDKPNCASQAEEEVVIAETYEKTVVLPEMETSILETEAGGIVRTTENTTYILTENIDEELTITESGSSVVYRDDQNEAEMVTIGKQEFYVDATEVMLFLSEDTDISELSKFTNLESLYLYKMTDGGGTIIVSGFDCLKNCTTLTYVLIQVSFDDPNDIHVLETMPNLRVLSIYGPGKWEDFKYDLPQLEMLDLNGEFDLTKIQHLTGLKGLSISWNHNQDVLAIISCFTELETLYLEYITSTSTDLTLIENLTKLEHLEIWESNFTNYESILKLDNLEELWISSIYIDPDTEAKIKEKIPDAHI